MEWVYGCVLERESSDGQLHSAKGRWTEWGWMMETLRSHCWGQESPLLTRYPHHQRRQVGLKDYRLAVAAVLELGCAKNTNTQNFIQIFALNISMNAILSKHADTEKVCMCAQVKLQVSAKLLMN